MCRAPESSFRLLGRRLNRSQGYRPSRRSGIATSVFKCDCCGLIFSNPMPIPGNIQDHYGVPPEDYWKEEYFKVEDHYFSEEVKWLDELKPIKAGMKSLDIGAGLGKQMIALKRFGFDAYGLEASVPFYNRAIEKMGIDKGRLMLSTFEEASFENNMFDFISFGAVLEHLYDPSEAIRKAQQWAKPQGLIHIEVPNSRWLMNRLYNLAYKGMGKDYVSNLSPMHQPYHLYEFSLESFKRNASVNGYRIRDHKYYVCKTFAPKLLDPFLKFYMRKTDTGMQLCVWLEK